MANPVHQLPDNDSGAETLRNFQYQCAYGVILLAGAHRKGNEYRAIWCEQEDDLLAEIEENRFDSYQVKTQAPELGPWDTKKKGFIKAISVFAHLEETYPQSIQWFNFVSNTEISDTNDPKKKHKCPGRLAEAARNAQSIDDLAAPYRKTLTMLAKDTKCSEPLTFAVLKRLRFVKSPSKESFIAELAATHLPPLDLCQNVSPHKIKRAVRNAISLVEEASALSSQDPARHYACLKPGGKSDPQLLMKRVCLQKFANCLNEIVQPGFRYIPPISNTDFARKDRDFQRFATKLNRGGIDHYADTLRNQATTAEAILLDIATRGAEGKKEVDQLRIMVKAECDLAHLEASKDAEPFGAEMLRKVTSTFKKISKEDVGKAFGQPYEVLMGTAGILTEDCEVWWSAKFDLGKTS